MVRFFVSPHHISGDDIKLGEQDTAHLRSLRLRPGELFVVCDENGTDYICELAETADERQVAGERVRVGKGGESFAVIVEKRPSSGEANVRCCVFIAFSKGGRLDYAVQKSVELGAYEIVLFPSQRSISVPSDAGKKATRLQKIAYETAKQCGRGRVPEVSTCDSMQAAVAMAAQADLPLFLYECEEKFSLKQALENAGKSDVISVVIGPEGGFEPHEAELAVAKGLLAVTLGSRILRCETAPAAALAAIMFHTGNLG